MCWTLFKTIGHSSKNLGPSQKCLCPSWCHKLVTGLKQSRKILDIYRLLRLINWSYKDENVMMLQVTLEQK